MQKQGGLLRRIGVFFLLLFFLAPSKGYFMTPEVRINEVAWMGNSNSSSDEWIELYNPGTKEIDLENWYLIAKDGSPKIVLSGVLSPNGYFLLERTDDTSVTEESADLIYTGALSNSGEVLELKNDQGELVDIVDASGGWPAGDNDTKYTMSLSLDGIWRNSSSVGGSPGRENINTNNDPNVLNSDDDIIDVEEGPGVEQAEDIASSSPQRSATSTDIEVKSNSDFIDLDMKKQIKVLINEIVSDPLDGEEEWVELYCDNKGEIDISSWYLEEGSGSKTLIEDGGLIGGVNKYFVINNPKGNLNNNGDIIVLYDDNGKPVDRLVYGDWEGTDSNPPSPPDPFSLARIVDGKNTDNNFEDFALTSNPSKGKKNEIVYDSKEVIENKSAQKDRIIISEVMPNPRGSDEIWEYIELYNMGPGAVNLLEWQLGDESENRFRFKESINIRPGEYLVIFRKESGIALNNNGDKISLYKRDRKSAVDNVIYKKAKENMSLNCLDEDLEQLGRLANLDCVWSLELSPGEKNKIKKPNRSPIPDFSVGDFLLARTPIWFDASDTVDPDGDELNFTWDFGDGFTSSFQNPDHTYAEAGVYMVSLEVSDGKLAEEVVYDIVIMDWQINEEETVSEYVFDPANLKIRSFMPNPEGLDQEGEWIEIVNKGMSDVNLLNWKVDDSEGGSRPFEFFDNMVLASGESYLLSREDSGIALNNNKDEIRLISPDDRVIDLVMYDQVYEGQSMLRLDDDTWQWSNIKEESPNKKNIQQSASKVNIYQSEIRRINLSEVSGLQAGDMVSVRGVVAVLPGVLSSQYFYIVGSSGLQVYSYKKDFPDLRIGDVVLVSGEISEVGGEKRIKTSSSEDIVIVESGAEPLCIDLSCKELASQDIGSLVQVKGELLEKKGSNLYLHDGSAEAHVYIKSKSGIDISFLELGEEIRVSGILSLSGEDLRILPRRQSDIESLSGAMVAEAQVLGTSTNAKEWSLEPRQRKGEIYFYFILFFAVVIIVGGIFYIRRR